MVNPKYDFWSAKVRAGARAEPGTVARRKAKTVQTKGEKKMSRLRERTTAILLIAIFMISTMTLAVSAKPEGYSITKGDVLYKETHYYGAVPIPTGYDDFGYNYQGHMFKGYYCNAYLGGAGLSPYTGSLDDYPTEDLEAFEAHWTYPHRDVKLVMKWNDAWLSNRDRDMDGSLDRHWGYESYIGSGAWDTNHQFGSYIEDGKEYKWNYFVKIVSAPADAYADEGFWYSADDIEIGEVIWGAHAIIQQVFNDQGTGEHGIEYLSPVSAGLGCYK